MVNEFLLKGNVVTNIIKVGCVALPWSKTRCINRGSHIAPVALCHHEYLVRHHWGDRPDRQSYANRFPLLGIRLTDALPQTASGKIERRTVAARLIHTNMESDAPSCI